MHTHGKANGVVHKEQDLPVTYVLASKGKDHNEYTRAKTDGNPPMTQLVVNKLHTQSVT